MTNCRTCGPDGCPDRVACPRAIADAVQQAADAVGPDGVRAALRTDWSDPAAPRAQKPAGELIGHIDFGSDQPSTPVYTAPQPAAGPAGKSTNDQFCDVVQFNGVTIKHDAALQPAAAPGKFHLGTLVRKKSGAEWQGRIVGSYSTTLTPIGWAVESTAHAGSVQIYPEAALELVEGAASQEPAEKRTDWSAA